MAPQMETARSGSRGDLARFLGMEARPERTSVPPRRSKSSEAPPAPRASGARARLSLPTADLRDMVGVGTSRMGHDRSQRGTPEATSVKMRASLRSSADLADRLADMLEAQASAALARETRIPEEEAPEPANVGAPQMGDSGDSVTRISGENGPDATEHVRSDVTLKAELSTPKWGGRKTGSSGGEEGTSKRSRFEESRNNTSQFITFSSSVQSDARHHWLRRALGEVVRSSRFDCCIIFIVMFNLVLITADTDARAEFPDRAGKDAPEWVARSMDACFVVYLMELVLRLYLERRKFFRSMLNVADLVAVVAGIFEYMLLWLGSPVWGKGLFSLARLCRLVRLTRVLRLIKGSTELRKLVQLMAGCFKTLFWSFILVLLVMTIWSIIAVELINPYIQELARQGYWTDCDRCTRSFASVFMANLTLFQTVVAGDSWGLIAAPVIEAYPHLAIIFTCSLMTLVFGVLNLIVAVIVDAAAERRAKDVEAMAKEFEDEELEEKSALEKIFKDIDVDGNKSLSYSELLGGAKRVRDFANWLRVLDVDSEDLFQLFQIVDEDGSGEIDPQEFVNAMYRMKHTESKTAMKLIKHMLTRLDGRQESTANDMVVKIRDLESKMNSRFSVQDQTLKHVLPVEEFANQSDAIQRKLLEHESAFQKKLQEQTDNIRNSFEDALNRASEVALEAALEASERMVQKVHATSRDLSIRVSNQIRCSQLLVPSFDGSADGHSGCGDSRSSRADSAERDQKEEKEDDSTWGNGSATRVEGNLLNSGAAVPSGPRGRPTANVQAPSLESAELPPSPHGAI